MLNGSAFPSCNECPIRYRAVCSKCDEQELGLLEDIKYYRTFEAGQPIMFAGDELSFVASVVSGVAVLSQAMTDGRVQMTGLLLPSDFIGRPDRTEITHDVTAMTDVSLCCFRRKPFEAMVAKTPHISQRLLEMTLDELDAAREWMLLLGRKTAREKITSLLSMIARRTAPIEKSQMKDGVTFDLPISRETMANYLGLTIETVSRQISALRREGVIDLHGTRSIVIPQLRTLFEETGDEMEHRRIA